VKGLKINKEDFIKNSAEESVAMAFLMKDGTVFTTYGNDVSMTNDSKSASLLIDAISNIQELSKSKSKS